MARNSISYILRNTYVSDIFNASEDIITGRINYPNDMDNTTIRNIVGQISAEVTRKDGVNEPGFSPVSCPSGRGLTPRKLRFYRANGNTFSIILPVRGNIANVVNNIRGIVDGIGTANGEVVCVDLIGEKWADVLRPLGGGAATPGTVPPFRPPAGDAKNANYYRGSFTYSLDSPNGDVLVKRFKIATDDNSTAPPLPPSDFGTPLADCLGTVILGDSICPPSDNIKVRKYIATTQTDLGGGARGSQTTEVPVASSSISDINSCGAALASISAMLCLQFEGESQRNVQVA